MGRLKIRTEEERISIHKKANNVYARGYRRKLRQDVVEAYGGVCECCGITEWKFLTIDHKYGGGNQERRDLGLTSSHEFYRYLKNNNYPKDLYQLLCFNCNLAS